MVAGSDRAAEVAGEAGRPLPTVAYRWPRGLGYVLLLLFFPFLFFSDHYLTQSCGCKMFAPNRSLRSRGIGAAKGRKCGDV